MSEKKNRAWRQLWNTFFGKSWPMWVGGLILATLNICLFLVKSPWGGSGTYINWGENLYQAIGIFGLKNIAPVHHNLYGLLGTMTLLGALLGALLSREFALRIPPAGEMLKGFIGGIFMALGCTLGIGCTVGGFLSGIPALNAGAIFIGLGFIIGAWLALRYLLWEMEKLPKMSSGKSLTILAAKGKGGIWQPMLGVIIFAFLLIGASRLFKNDNVLTWFAIIGLFLGLVCQRSRFCVTRSFREPFMTGESEAPVAIMLTLLVTLFGFTVIKYMGVGASTPGAARVLALTWVYPHFWLKALIGGIIFGIGMVIAGGCAVGTLWRIGEGQIKLWFAGLGFILMAPISKKFIVPGFSHLLPEWAQKTVFLPDVFKYWGTVLLLLVIILLWYLFVKWNERTGKFSAI
ncbi:YeeE/YedE family protein [bacterium]|nr:YeeE/YedE family protein [bacterium]